jgi:drug/metabolite transporter (DMT)-like permease
MANMREEPNSSLRAGVAAALAAAVLFGATTPIAKQVVAGTGPLLVAGLLYLGSGVGLTVLRAVQDRAWRPAGLSRSDWGWLAAATCTGGILAPALLMIGLSHSDAATASLLLNLEAVFGALLAWLVFREATSARVVLGFVAILAGGILLAWPHRAPLPGRLLGIGCVAGACLAWGLDNNLTRRIAAADARVIAGIKGLAAGATNTILAVTLGYRWPGRQVLAEILLLGFLGYGVSLVLFILALRQLGTSRTGAYFATSPFVGAALAVWLFGEPTSLAFWAAALLMLLGVWLHATERHEHAHTHEALTHTHPHRHDEHHRHEHGEEWEGLEPHSHEHTHEPVRHTHAHFPDIHHRHQH